MAKKVAKKPSKKKPLPKKKPAKAPAKKALKAAPKKAAAKPAKKAAKVKAPVKAQAKVKPAKVEAKKAVAKKPLKVDKKAEKELKLKGKAAAAEPAPEAPVENLEAEQVEELVLTDAEGRRFCRVRDCDQLASVEGYCRYHYLLFWKKIQVRKKILTEGKLERYIEELTARYPDKFLDMLRKDLRSEKEFLIAIQELEIDESAMENELEEEAQTYIDEVRGIEPAGRETEEDF